MRTKTNKIWDFGHYREIHTGRSDLLAGSAFNYLSLNSEYAYSGGGAEDEENELV